MPGPRVRIESDGRPDGTIVMVGDKRLDTVVDVKWEMDWESFGRVTVTLDDVDLVINQDASRWKRPVKTTASAGKEG
jgi:hypothetical protein